MGIYTDRQRGLLALREVLREWAVTGLPQITALLTIATKPGLSVNELAEELGVPQQSASRSVLILTGSYQGLADSEAPKEFVEQRINLKNPRRRALFLTNEGEVAVSNIWSRIRGDLSDVSDEQATGPKTS